MYSQYSIKQLEDFVVELTVVIETRKYDELLTKVTEELKLKCKDEYYFGGIIPAIKALRVGINESSLKIPKLMIEKWAAEEGWPKAPKEIPF
jgi:hypothetical protein